MQSPETPETRRRTAKTQDSSQSSEALSIYLGEIAAIPMLSRRAEGELAAEIDQYRREFQQLVLDAPETPDTLVAIWRELRERGHGTAPLSAAYKGGVRSERNLGAEIDARFSKVERLRNRLATLDRGDAERADLETASRKLLEQANLVLAAFEQVREMLLRTRPDRPDVRALDRAWCEMTDRKRRFAAHNLRLVATIARDFSEKGVALPDLIQEGNIGLMRAVDRFDHTKGFKFSTYAVFWIRQSMVRAIQNQARTIRVPTHVLEEIRKMQKVQEGLTGQLGREPETDEVARALKMSTERTLGLAQARRHTLSLDYQSASDETMGLSEAIEDPDVPCPQAAIDLAHLQRAAAACIASLGSRDRSILRWRYGLDGQEPLTLEAIGERLGVTRERVRQLETRALAKLRTGTTGARLAEFVDGHTAYEAR